MTALHTELRHLEAMTFEVDDLIVSGEEAAATSSSCSCSSCCSCSTSSCCSSSTSCSSCG
jgi:hypothetical protein